MEGQRPLVDPSRSQTPALHTHCVEADTDRDPGGAEEAAQNQKPLLFHLCLDLAKICFFTCYFLSWWFLCMASAMPRAASNRAPHTAPGPHPAENRAEENGSSVQSQPVQLYNSLTAPSHFLPVKCHSWNVHSPIPIAWILWFSQPDIMHQDKHSALQMLNYTVTIPRCPPNLRSRLALVVGRHPPIRSPALPPPSKWRWPVVTGTGAAVRRPAGSSHAAARRVRVPQLRS